MPDFTLLQKIIIWVIPVIFAITLHEAAHGWVANRLGDPTAKFQGRLTLNPINHIDLFGTIIIPALMYFTSGIIFGWAKPVPVDYRNLRKPKRDAALVAFAGPLTNFFMAVLWAIFIKFGIHLTQQGIIWGAVLLAMGKIGLAINLLLMVLNLIPIPPLDGSRILASFLSPSASITYNKIEPYGFIIILVLFATGILAKIMSPAILFFQILILKFIAFI